MKLSEVWNYLGEDVKRAIRAVAKKETRLRTRTVLAALAEVAGIQNESNVLKDILIESGIEFDYPEVVPDDPEPIPEQLEFTPCVEETLNFFRMHQIRSVSVNDFARRLLQIGTGNTVRSLEEMGLLDEAIERLENTLR